MIDSHCHLTDPRLLERLGQVLGNARAAGVSPVVTIATTPADALVARELATHHSDVYYVAGIHPNNTGPFTVEDVEQLRVFAADPKCVALGEMGLDYHWKDVAPDHQKRMFIAQLKLASELKMPVVIHCREAVADALATMREFPDVRAVYHCFTGTVEEARAIFAAGYYLGFTGPLTFKKNDFLRQIVREAPADKLLIETDAPYLTPEPHRSVKTNEPRYVAFVLETIAKVRGISIAEADQLTAANTRRLYRM